MRNIRFSKLQRDLWANLIKKDDKIQTVNRSEFHLKKNQQFNKAKNKIAINILIKTKIFIIYIYKYTLNL